VKSKLDLVRINATFLLAAIASLLFCAPIHAAAAQDSKKGLQIQMVDDALALGIRHAAINVNLVQLSAPNDQPSIDAMLVDDRYFDFNRRYAAALDSKIRPLLDHGVIVYLILLAYDSPNKALAATCIDPKYNAACPNHVGAFNTASPEGSARFRANITFLAHRYANEDKPPLHFIVGNEVNSHWFWYNMGEAPMEQVAREYERAVRICAQAAACISPCSRVYLSLDHHWNASVTPNEPLKSFGAHSFLLAFSRIAKQRGDFEWHLAFHPYPENLFESRTWNDKQATTGIDTPKITFKNIQLLNEFMKSPELLYACRPRRIILSEQGFHTPHSPDGENIQAAAYAYAYRKIARLDGIDAFILHRHVDNNREGGLSLGLWTGGPSNTPVKKKLIYEVFKRADTDQWQEAFKFALPVIGIRDWDEIK